MLHRYGVAGVWLLPPPGVVSLPGLVVGLNRMSEWLASLRTTNGIRLLPIRSVIADQMRDVHAGDKAWSAPSTTPKPPSYRSRSSPVGWVSLMQAGWVCGSVAVGSMSETTLRAPSPW